MVRSTNTCYDGANRPNTASGSFGAAQTNYITQTAYWSEGDIYYFIRGNGIWYAAGYNSRLQPTETFEATNNLLAHPTRALDDTVAAVDPLGIAINGKPR